MNRKNENASGYSGTPLSKKLGYKTEFRAHVKNPPDSYFALLEPLPSKVKFLSRATNELDLIHFFTRSTKQLSELLPRYMQAIKQGGMIWVSWPKKSSKVETDITEDTVRAVALPLGLVDIKVCAVNEIWSALKLVIRKENRR